MHVVAEMSAAVSLEEWQLLFHSKLAEVQESGSCVRLMVSGSGSQCGKTTACLAILGAALHAGFKSEQVAYIKPVTQCEDDMLAACRNRPDLLSAWTMRHGVANVSGKDAPQIFFSGFSKSFLEQKQPTSQQICSRIETEVTKLSEGRRLLVIDGVGHPAEGSICGVDNVDVALAASASVVLIGESNLGAAVDNFNSNAAYFSQRVSTTRLPVPLVLSPLPHTYLSIDSTSNECLAELV